MSIPLRGQATSLARGLGWFSVGLGVVQLVVPDALNRLIGVQPTQANRDLQRMIGVREVLAGIAILLRSEPSGFLWARVAGDAMDLAALGNALASETDRARTGLALGAVTGVTALDVLAATRPSAARPPVAA